MKIAFVVEYFPPYAQGGSEWSTYYLAQTLSEKGQEVIVITPNYGNEKNQKREGKFKVVYFPFYLKRAGNPHLPGNFALTNPLWLVWSFINIFYYLLKNNVDIVHIHGKYSLPASRLAAAILGKPIILTTRDYQLVCNYGFCLQRGTQACGLKDYLTRDFQYYWQNYVTYKNIFSFTSNLLFAIWGRISRNVLRIFAKGVPIVTLSSSQRNIYEKNGLKVLATIGNSITIEKTKPNKKENYILYAGRLTPGKGITLLMDAIPEIVKKHPHLKIIIVGDGFLKSNLLKLKEEFKQVKLTGQIDHYKLMDLIRASRAVIVPSIWPEPFGRVAIESLVNKTPVIVTNRGALPEIVDPKWGIIINPKAKDLSNAVTKILNRNNQYVDNIKNDYDLITKKYSTEIATKYMSVYREQVK